MDLFGFGESESQMYNIIALCILFADGDEADRIRRGYHAFPFCEYYELLLDEARFKNLTGFSIRVFNRELLYPCYAEMLKTRSVDTGRRRRYELSPGIISMNWFVGLQ